MPFDAKHYWEDRLTRRFDLSGTGTLGFSPGYVGYLYELKSRAMRRTIKAHRIDISGKSILDIGSGTGFFINLFSRYQPGAIVGLDITEVSVRRLSQSFPSHTFIRADFGEPVTLRTSFDIINAQDVFYHIVDDEKFDQAMGNLTALSRGGTFLFFSEVFGTEMRSDATHVKFRSRGIYEEALKNVGFRILDVRPIYCLMNLPLLNLPYRLLNGTAPVLYASDLVLVSLNVGRRNNTKLITCQREV